MKKAILYGLELEVYWDNISDLDEEIHWALDKFYDILHKHQAIDALGQVSYSTENGSRIECMRWFEYNELRKLLDDLRRKGFGASVLCTVYPKLDKENKLVFWLEDAHVLENYKHTH